MSAALETLLAAGSIPAGFTIGLPDQDAMHRADEAHDAAMEADEAVSAVLDEVRTRLADASDGSVTLMASDVAKLVAMLELVEGRLDRVIRTTADLTVLAVFSGGEAE